MSRKFGGTERLRHQRGSPAKEEMSGRAVGGCRIRTP